MQQNHSSQPTIREKEAQVALLHKKSKKALNFLIFGILAFIASMVLVLFFVEKYHFVATKDGKPICDLKSESTARSSTIGLLDYTKDAVISSYSYDYIGYKEQMRTSAKKWFTPAGAKSYLESVSNRGGLENVLKGRMTVKTHSTALAQIEKEGITEELKRYWIIRVPIMVEYYLDIQGKPKTTERYMAEVELLQDEPSADNLKGFSVNSIELLQSGNF